MTPATDKDSTFCVFMLKAKRQKINKQECIPVGCIPSAAVVILEGGGGDVCLGKCLPRGMSAQGGVCPGGVSAGGCPSRGVFIGGVSLGVSAQGVSVWGCLAGGVHPFPVNRMTDKQV